MYFTILLLTGGAVLSRGCSCLQGVQLSPGGAVVSTAPTKRQVHPNWCNLLCWCS